jgi:hypothetical protein
MLVKEMHIELDLVAKRVASKNNLVIKKQEADWFLNKGMDNFMRSRRNPQNSRKGIGLDETKKRVEELHTLMTTVYTSFYKNDDLSQFAFLPDDFDMHVRDSYYAGYNCNGLTLTNTNTPVYIAVLPFTNLGDLFASYTIQELDSSNNVLKTLAVHTGAIAETDQKFEVLREVLYKLRQIDDLEVYWERFNNKYYENSLIFVRKSLGTTSKVRATNGVQTSVVSYTQITLVQQTTTNSIVKSGRGRLHQNNEVDEILNYSFTSTVVDSPVTTIQDGKLIVYHDNTFIINSGVLTYIRKPRPINLDLGWNCEIPEPHHYEVVLHGAEELLVARGYQNVNLVNNMVGLKE